MSAMDDINPESIKEAIADFVEAGIPKPVATAAISNMVHVCRAIAVIDDADEDKAGKAQMLKAAKYLASLRVPPFRG